MNIILFGLIASLLAGLATSVGAIPVFFIKRLNQKVYASMLGFAAGVMLAATFFSLLVPALGKGSVFQVIVGFILGVIFLEVCDKFIPHQHFLKGKEGSSSHLRKISLFIFAITIHNFPEGLSVGVGFGAGDIKSALALAMGIGIQNIPEGAAVAFPLRAEGYSKRYSFSIATLTGLVEPLGGILGVTLVVIFFKVLPIALAFAAGCMLYVISGEIIPESHKEGFGKIATIWLIIGFIVMMSLDTIFG
ncbi:MAG: ZIP family metal transporter [Candidatus Omnitrophota bacterium]|nr:MAG: ZIP family metal transporter [Candidatus Omnitrophota bacterium]